jgi:hypothetical protein
MQNDEQYQYLNLEKEVQNGVYHLKVGGERIGSYPNYEAWKAAAIETLRAWIKSLGVDPKSKIEEYIPRHAVPESHIHKTVIRLERPNR